MARSNMSVISLTTLFCGFGLVVKATESERVAIDLVRNDVVAVANNIPQRRAGTDRYMREFGFQHWRTPEHANLATVVSNNYDVVISNFCACATNDLERMVLMSAGWAYDDDYYLRWYSDIIDLAVVGVLSRDEVRWYNEGSGNEMRMNLLALRYDFPGISNVVLKLQGLSGNTNYGQKILNGEAKRLYLEYKAEIEYNRAK